MEIKIQNVSRYFGSHFALKNISLHFLKGSKIGLVGPNGSGKSTLMRIMMDLVHFDEGEIKFLIHSPKTAKKIGNTLDLQVRKKIAYVPQIFPYFSSPLKSIIQTIRDIHDFPIKEFKEILKAFSLDYSLISNRPFHKLSGGMKQKILIALSFASKPDLLLLDEPTSSLDPLSRQTFYKMCFNLKKEKSLILCSHRLEEIRHLIDKMVVLEEGKIKYFGSASNYLQKMTLCLLEVLVKPNPENEHFLKTMGFAHSSSSWWHKIFTQEEKLDHLEKVQKNLKENIQNIIIRDVDKGTDFID